MNGNSIKELVDVELWGSLLYLFSRDSHAPDWFIEPEGTRTITVWEFRHLAMTTEDEREISAIALFLWFEHYQFCEFEQRCLRRMAEEEKFNVFVEGMLLQTDLPDYGVELLHNVLTINKRRSWLEMLIALTTLEKPGEDLIRQMLLNIGQMIQETWFEPLAEQKALGKLAEYSKFEMAPSYVKSLNKLLSVIPKGNAIYSKTLELFGIHYRDQLMLAWIFQKGNYSYYSPKAFTLAGLIVEALGVTFKDWTEHEKVLLLTVAKYVKEKATIVNARNLLWTMQAGIWKIFTVNLRYDTMLDTLQKVQSDTAWDLIGDSLEHLQKERVVGLYEEYSSIFDLLFTKYRKELVPSYKVIRELRTYPEFEAARLSDFQTRESYDLMLTAREDRNSDTYRLLMQGGSGMPPDLDDSEVRELTAERQIYFALYDSGRFGGDGNGSYSEDYEEDYEEDYDEDDYYEG